MLQAFAAIKSYTWHEGATLDDQMQMRSFLQACLDASRQDVASVLQALAHTRYHGLARVKEICRAPFSYQVRINRFVDASVDEISGADLLHRWGSQ